MLCIDGCLISVSQTDKKLYTEHFVSSFNVTNFCGYIFKVFKNTIKIWTNWQTTLSHRKSAFQTSKIISKHLKKSEIVLLSLNINW